MKETLTLLWAAVLYLALGSCDDETCEREVTYTKATPVFGQIDKYRLPITNTRIAPIVNPGHYILIDTILFVLDIDRGIHVVSSQNSQHINYINIPGIREFVIEDDTLVANSYYDVLQIDIARPQHAKLIYREEEAFPIPFYNERGLPVVGFQLHEFSEKVDCQSPFYDDEIYFFNANDELIAPATIPSILFQPKDQK